MKADDNSLAPYYYGSTVYYGDSVAGTPIPTGSPTGSELGDKVIFSQNIRNGSDYQAQCNDAENGRMEG